MRLDRVASVYLFHPILDVLHDRKRQIPILMYHSISECRGTRPHPYFDINTDITTFSSQMRHLADKIYLALTLEDLPGWFQSPEAKTRKAVVITFDDGYEDFLTAAFPVLQTHGFTATVFLPTSRIGETSQVIEGKRYLNWSHVSHLRRHGILFGSHTATHPQLALLNQRQIRYELDHSKTVLEGKLGEAIPCFSHPFAFPVENSKYKQYLKQILKECGYTRSVTTILGTASSTSDLLFLPRIPVNRWDDIPLFTAKLDGAYNWVRGPQWMFKYLTSLRRSAKSNMSATYGNSS